MQSDAQPAGASIDVTIRRECFYQRSHGATVACPRCGASMVRQHQPYVVATRRGNMVTDRFVIGTDAGSFCPRCPTVVIDEEEIDRLLSHGMAHWDMGQEFAILGLVNLDAIPPEKRDLPIGGDDNPIPLVEFMFGRRQPAGRTPGPARGGSRPGPRRRRR